MRKIRYTTKFKKDLKKIKSQPDSGFDQAEFRNVLETLQNSRPLDAKYLDHPLCGRYVGTRECHLKPDLLLIYEIRNKEVELLLLRIGSHSELF